MDDAGRADSSATDLDLDADRLREECGVFGIFGHPDAAAITAIGLHALQHRGQEAAGIVSFDGQRYNSERRLGLVGDNFSKASTMARLPGEAAIGHVRYSTTGETILRNVQPLFAELNSGGFAVAHNGNLTNGLTLRRDLVQSSMKSLIVWALSENENAVEFYRALGGKAVARSSEKFGTRVLDKVAYGWNS